MAAPAASAKEVERVDPSPYALVPAGSETRTARALDRLRRRAGRAPLSAVLARANHALRPLGPAPVAGTLGGFRWSTSDEASPDWYPQGIATLERRGRLRGLVASWYSRGGAGTRVSFVNQRGAATRYRHVLLVEPVRRRGRWRVERVKTHAGGIAVVGRRLYVADTWDGLRVFDLGRMMRARGAHRRLGYRYVLPQLQRYAQPPRVARFSFVSVDRTTSPASLITGEYRSGEPGGRILRWTLSPRGRVVSGRALEAFSSPVGSMQGALSLNGRLFMASSRGTKPGKLTVGPPGGKLSSRAWAVGPEALAYSPATGLLYSLTEHPLQRTVFAIRP